MFTITTRLSSLSVTRYIADAGFVARNVPEVESVDAAVVLMSPRPTQLADRGSLGDGR